MLGLPLQKCVVQVLVEARIAANIVALAQLLVAHVEIVRVLLSLRWAVRSMIQIVLTFQIFLGVIKLHISSSAEAN